MQRKSVIVRLNALVAVGMAATSFLVQPALGEGFSNTNAQLFYTTRSKADPVNGTGTDDEKLTAIRLEHYGTFAYGDNYFFVDDYNGRDVGGPGSGSFGSNTRNQQFGVWMPRLSFGKLLGTQLSYGPIQDVQLASRLEVASYGSYHAQSIGVGVDWKVPFFNFVTTRLLEYETNFNSTHLFFHTAWGAAWPVGSRKLHFDGFFWTVGTDNNGRRWYVEPDSTIDVDAKGTFQAGARLTYETYKNSDGSDYKRTTPWLLIKWNF